MAGDDMETRKPAPRVIVPVEPQDEDIDEEIGHEELEIDGDLDEDVQEELDLDADDDGDDLLGKSEGLLDEHDDYRSS